MKYSYFIDDCPDIFRDLVIRRLAGNVVVNRPKLNVDNESMWIASAQAAKETTEALNGVVISGEIQVWNRKCVM